MTNTILKYIPAEELVEAPKEEVVESTPNITKTRVEEAVKYLKWIGVNPVPLDQSEYGGKGYKEIAKAVGLTEGQVKLLHEEYRQAKAEVNKQEEVTETL